MEKTTLSIIFLLFITLASARESFGLTFTGEVRATVTDSGFPGNDYEDYFWLGRVLVGTYTYESPTIDGVFTPASGNLKLFNLLGFLDERDDRDHYPHGPVLTVVGGQVTSFRFHRDDGFTIVDESGWNYDGIIDVDTAITNPVRVPGTAVPDSGGTLLLGLMALGCLGAGKNRFRSKESL